MDVLPIFSGLVASVVQVGLIVLGIVFLYNTVVMYKKMGKSIVSLQSNPYQKSVNVLGLSFHFERSTKETNRMIRQAKRDFNAFYSGAFDKRMGERGMQKRIQNAHLYGSSAAFKRKHGIQ